MLCTPWGVLTLQWAVGQHRDNHTEENAFPVYTGCILQVMKGNGPFLWTAVLFLTLGEAKAISNLGNRSWILCRYSSICSGKLFSFKLHSSTSSLSSLFMHLRAVHTCSSWLAVFSSFPLPAFSMAEMLKALAQTRALQPRATSARTEDDWCWL